MLTYFLIIIPTLAAIFLVFSYWQERNYRRKPFYKLADIGWRKSSLPPANELVHSVLLLGDPGAVATDGSDPVLQLVQQWKQETGSGGTALLLGDIVYPVGLPPEGSIHHATALLRLNTLLDTFKDFEGRCILLSGNHDWNKGRKGGYKQMLRQEDYVVNYLHNELAYLPRRGCPGPVTIRLAEGLLLLILNTQWWVQRGEKPLGEKKGCEVATIDDFFVKLKNILHQNRHQTIVVAAHHPLYSNALHGGKFTLKQHIFPLTAAHKRIYIPLPIFGSIYPFYRKMFGAYEDMSHARYKRLRKRLLRIFHRNSNIIYAAGHDHNLQHFEVRNNHYIVSGSGSKTAFVKKGGKATFTLEQLGIVVLNYYRSGELWMEVRAVTENQRPEDGPVVFRKELKTVLQQEPQQQPQ